VKAKNGAMKYIQEKYNVQPEHTFVVFMDSPAFVTAKWLLPLANSISKYEKSLVYPSIDVLVPQQSSETNGQTAKTRYQVTRSDDMVAAFTWDFIPKWESVVNEKRLKHLPDGNGIEWLSPSVPGIFAISWKYFHSIDQFDESLFDSSYYHQENIDLSIRNWLCEGIIIQQTCSRVAMPFETLNLNNKNNGAEDITLGTRGITQRNIDENIINLAMRYLSFSIPEVIYKKMTTKNDGDSNSIPAVPVSLTQDYTHLIHRLYQEKKMRDFSYQKRYLYRIDNPLLLLSFNIDPVRTGPYQSFTHLPAPSKNVICSDFMWFLEEIHPGLITDSLEIIQDYFIFHYDSVHYRSLVKKLLGPYVETFKKHYETKYLHKILPQTNTQEGEDMKKLLKDREKNFIAGNRILDSNTLMETIKHPFEAPFAVKKYGGFTYEELQDHITNQNREHLKCVDFKDPTPEKLCETMTLNGDPTACQQHKPKVLFLCPQMCGYCDRDQGNAFCEDFYLVKCMKNAFSRVYFFHFSQLILFFFFLINRPSLEATRNVWTDRQTVRTHYRRLS
jgi:hypothetical protein